MSLVRVVVLVGILALLVRVPAVGGFMTVDEQNWMVRTGDFIRSVERGDIEGTFQGTHPGATAMWLMGSGIKLQELRLGVHLNSDNLILFHKAAVMPLTIVNSILIAVIAGLLVLLVGWPAGLVSGVLLATEPYLVGMSQIAHLDALQSFLMLASLLSFASYLQFKQRRFAYLTGLTLGLALGTKLLLALWLLPSFVGMILLTLWWQHNLQDWWRYSRAFVGVLFMAVIVFVLVWPTVVTKKDLQLGYISRDTKTIVTDEHGVYESAENPIDIRTFYIRTVLGRTTPYILILSTGALTLIIVHVFQKRGQLPGEEKILLYLVLYALGYLFFISLAAKKADRYALPAIAALPLWSGLFLAYVWPRVERRFSILRRGRTVLFLAGFLAVMIMPIVWSPYAIAYSNPFFLDVRPLTQQGWGEGLEAAAAWLNERPGADDMYIASWYPSVMRTYFHGVTLSLSSMDDYRVQYVITYRNMGGRAPDDRASNALDAMRGKEPVHVIDIQGIPYVWIYETRSVGNFTKHVGELVGTKAVGQTVQPKPGLWAWVDVGFATYSSRANTKDVIVHVRQSPTSTEDLRVVRVNAKDIVDNEWQRFEFAPIEVTQGQEFYIEIESPTSVPGNAVTVRYTDLDILPGQMYSNGNQKPADIAYKIAE